MSINPSNWILPSRTKFQEWISETFAPDSHKRSRFQYLLDLFNNFYPTKPLAPSISVAEIKTTFELSQIQQLVANLLREESPYRGILLYHALGSGKTCSAISIANSLIHEKDIIFISKTSIEPNFVGEMKKCGLEYFRTMNEWEWLPINKIPPNTKYPYVPEAVIKKNGGVFIIKPGAGELSQNHKQLLHRQLEESIRSRVQFLHIDDTRLAGKIQPNMFNGKIIIIDEVHNLTNNMALSKSKKSAALYWQLMNAKNCKIIMMSGTPVINNLFELSKLFNILSGSRPTINIYITGRLDKDKSQIIKDNDWSLIKYTLEKNVYLDQLVIHKGLNWIQASKVPDQFINVYNGNRKYLGVQYAPEMPVPRSYPLEIPPSDMKRLYNMGEQWENFSLQVCKAITNLGYKYRFIETVESCLPEDEDVFNHFFIDPETHHMMNKKLFMERIMGLTSSYHFRDESLFPRLKKVNLVRVPMTTYQYMMYTRYRKTELEKDRKSTRLNSSHEWISRMPSSA